MFLKSKLFIKSFFTLLVPLSFCIILSGIIFTYVSTENMKSLLKENNMNILQQSSNCIEIMLNELDSLQLTFNSNSTIMTTLRDILDGRVKNFEYAWKFNTIRQMLNSQIIARPYIHSIYVSFEGKNFLSSPYGFSNIDYFKDTDWYYSSMNHDPNDSLWLEVRELQEPTSNALTTTISLYRRITSSLLNKKDGIIVLNLHQKYLNNMLDSIKTDDNNILLIVDKNNHILAQNKQPNFSSHEILMDLSSAREQSFELLEINNEFLVSQLYSDKYNLRFISIIPKHILYNIPNTFTYIVLGLSGLLIIVSLIVGYLFTKAHYTQVQGIISIIDNSDQDIYMPLSSTTKNEYDYITFSLLNHFIEKRQLYQQLLTRKYELQSAQLLALQAQINPHFLFNTLEIINLKALSLTGKPNAINHMLEHLSDILRYSLSNPTESISLAEEIKHAKSYIAILKIRYKNQFDVIWEYDDAILTSPTLKLILQPFIENSIYHGIKELNRFGIIKIKLFIRNNHLYIYVLDNGKGMTKERLLAIKESITLTKFHRHIGLYNINKRLNLIYDKNYTFNVSSKPNKCTCMHIKIPVDHL